MVGPTSPNLKPPTLKFLCSYGGKILPRYPDGKLRYNGGDTRVISVDRSITFSELLVKLGEMCGTSVSLKCQLPTEDLDALVSITSDEDLANLIEEYDRASSLKIRAFLFSPPKSSKKISSPTPSSTASSSSDAASPKSPSSCFSAVGSASTRSPAPAAMNYRCIRQISLPRVFPLCYEKSAGKVPNYAYQAHGNPSHIYLIHNGNHWQ